jgi:hypothetical protein
VPAEEQVIRDNWILMNPCAESTGIFLVKQSAVFGEEIRDAQGKQGKDY